MVIYALVVAGGAVAVHAALDLLLSTPGLRMSSLYTFGQPRLGDAAFRAFANATLADTQHFRVTHHRDPGEETLTFCSHRSSPRLTCALSRLAARMKREEHGRGSATVTPHMCSSRLVGGMLPRE